ncbi:Ig-like domain repeat protein [Microbacterium album]|uniref:Bacterial Ig-like domain-containing protein n=1 Tax=Microbacterium album TaxID=2053191 RepID=A0A917IIF5_9MICO|nr:Ig-like domain repeat protein [Microbacterium album]GGH51117.1 hypothetical protein GCM10010921_30330 [Microbacterium album]
MTSLTRARRAGLSLLAAAGIVVAGLAGTAPAYADDAAGMTTERLTQIMQGQRLGALTFEPTSGVGGGGTGPTRITTERGCPADADGMSRNKFFWADGTESTAYPAALITRATTGLAGTGLDGNPMEREGTRAGGRWWSASFPAPNFKEGLASYVVTCEPATSPNPVGADSIVDAAYYFSVPVRFTRTGSNNWDWTWEAIHETAEPPAELIETTTAVAIGVVTADSVALTATVEPAAATGTVQFTRDGQPAGDPVPVVEGIARTTITGLTPETAYSFAAEYAGDATHAGSASTAITIRTDAAAAPEDEVTPPILVEVPEVDAPDEPSGLSISVSPASIALTGGARAEGQAWIAEASLGGVTVNDDRRNAGAQNWTLSGRADDFAGQDATISAWHLNWEPKVVSSPDGVNATAGAKADLSASRTLATGSATAGTRVATVVDADLELTVPANTPAGEYQSKLTLILI